MKKTRSILPLFVMLLFSMPIKAELNPFLLSRSVVKIQAVANNGKQYMGSGVVIQPDTIATNCHVTRHADRTFIFKEDRLYPARQQAALGELDICILKTDPLNLPQVRLAQQAPNLQQAIYMIGFPFGLSIQMRSGEVMALHPFQDGSIIEINTGFIHGTSGGGVFNQNGELVGLMTFMQNNDRQAHFYVIPSQWLQKALQQDFVPFKPFDTVSFWEKGDFPNAAHSDLFEH
jgi:serine protease Do